MMSVIDEKEWAQLLIKATARVRTLKDIGWTRWTGVQEGGHLGFLVDGIHYDFLVTECESPIPPGESGSAVFITLSDALLSTGVRVDSILELSGGSVILGDARLDSIERVWTVGDRTQEKRYRISRGPEPI